MLEIKSSFLSRKIKYSLKMGAAKVDINLLNQHFTPADWLADFLTNLLRHFDSQGTQGTRALEGHSGTWAPKVIKALEGHLSP